MLTAYTDHELHTILRKLWRRINDRLGYQPFGIDWRTLSLLFPGIVATYKAVSLELKRRHL